MPLRATLDNNQVQSFELDADAWRLLKETYRQSTMVMPCCSRQAIPKTSKLGLQYFAHARRGECTSAPETEDHLSLKSVVAKVAQENGWEVITEYEGNTPDGEKWIADVYCVKGASRVAIEVQWSQQTQDEYSRRTMKYTQSGIRCAWLFRLYGSKQRWSSEFVESYELPYFGIRKAEGDYAVSRYDASVPDFITGLLGGKVSWHPKPGDLLSIKMMYVETDCWKCKGTTNMITRLDVSNELGCLIHGFSFTDDIAAKWIANHVPKSILWEHNIGTVRERVSKTAKEAYISNGCIHCGALQGNHFLPHAFELDDNTPFIEIDWKYDASELALREGWFFNGDRGRLFY